MSRRTNVRNAFETQLNGSLTAGATTIALDSTSGLTEPGYLVIDPENPLKREYFKHNGISGSSLTSVTRGLAGSAAGAQAHDAGTLVRSIITHQLIDDIFSDIEAIEPVLAHVGSTDTADHPEVTTTTRGFMSAADKTKLDGISAGAKAVHNDLSGLTTGDPHTQYVAKSLLSAKGALLAATGAGVPAPRTVGSNGQVLSADSSEPTGLKWVTPSAGVTDHGALSGLGDDDHPHYLNNTRHDARDHTQAMFSVVLGDLGDVSMAGLVQGHILIRDLSTWRNISIAAAGISEIGHSHAASDITSGTLSIARIPTGTGSSQVALGNHGHSYLPLAGGSLSGNLVVGGRVEVDQGAAAQFRFNGTTTGIGYTGGQMVFYHGGTAVAALNNTMLSVNDAVLNNPTTTTNSGLPAWRHNQFSGGGPYQLLPLVSSARFKKNIKDADVAALAGVIPQVRLRRWQERQGDGSWIDGVVAEEVYGYYPQVVALDEDDRPLVVDPSNAFTIPLIAFVQELAKRVETLEAAA